MREVCNSPSSMVMPWKFLDSLWLEEDGSLFMETSNIEL